MAKPRFARCDSPENGIRALGKLLVNYRGKDGMPGVGGRDIDTVLETINRWASSTENDTQALYACGGHPDRRASHDADQHHKPGPPAWHGGGHHRP